MNSPPIRSRPSANENGREEPGHRNASLADALTVQRNLGDERGRGAVTALAIAGAVGLFDLDQWFGLDDLEGERLLAIFLFHDDADSSAAFQLAEQDLVGQRLLDVLLDDAGQRPRAVEFVEAVLGQPVGRLPS